MTITDLIKAQEARKEALLAERAEKTAHLERMGTGSEPVTDEAVDAVLAERKDIDSKMAAVDARLADLRSQAQADEAVAALQREHVPAAARPAYDEVARVGQEPRAYTKQKDDKGEASFIVDAFSAFRGKASRDAQERLARNDQEVRADGFAERATTTSSYAGLVVPQFLVDLAANVLRAGRPTANAVTRLPLPDQGMTFNLPRATTGVTEASQATENTAVSNTDQVWTNTTISVGTIAGQQQVSRQSLERGFPGIDQLIYADLAAAYAAELDRQIFVGTGSSGQINSINGQSGIGTASAFGAAVTAATFYSKVAGAISTIAGAGTAVRPSLIVMHPRRWSWLTLQVDSSNRPLVTPNANGPFNAYGVNTNPGAYGGDPAGAAGTSGFDVVGSLHGLPVITDASIPTNLGGGSTEDVVFVLDQRHALLFEDGDGSPRQLSFEQIQASGVAGVGLTWTLAAYNYVAFTAGRYPAAFYRVGGADSTGANGLQAPSF